MMVFVDDIGELSAISSDSKGTVSELAEGSFGSFRFLFRVVPAETIPTRNCGIGLWRDNDPGTDVGRAYGIVISCSLNDDVTQRRYRQRLSPPLVSDITTLLQINLDPIRQGLYVALSNLRDVPIIQGASPGIQAFISVIPTAIPKRLGFELATFEVSSLPSYPQ